MVKDKAVFLGIDQGGSSSKAALIDSTGEVVWEMKIPVSVSFLSPTRIEQDPQELLSSIEELIDQALSFVKKGSSLQLRGIGFAFQRSGVCAWRRESGEAVSKFLPWRDLRTSEQIAQQGPTRDLLWDRASLPLSAHYAAGKVSLLQNQFSDPSICVGTLDSFILANLLRGSFVTEDAMAHRTMLYALGKGNWDEQLCLSFGVDLKRLAKVVPSLGRFGVVGNVPILACLGDQQAGLYFHRQNGFGTILNLGTIASLLVDTGKIIQSAHGYITSIFYSSESDGQHSRTFLVEGTSNCCGRTFLELEERFQVSPKSVDSFFKDARGEVPVAFCPLAAISTPDWREDVPDLITGWSDKSNIASLVRALIENIGFFILEDLENLQAAGVIARDLEVLPVSGGASNCRSLMQHLADCSGIKVVKVASSNATVCGAALAAKNVSAGLEIQTPENCNDRLFLEEFNPRNSNARDRYQPWKKLKASALSGQYEDSEVYQKIVKQL